MTKPIQICHFYRTFYPMSAGGVETQIDSVSNFLSNFDSDLHFSLITDRQYLLPFLHKGITKYQKYGNLKVFRLGPNLPIMVLFLLKNYIKVPELKLVKIRRIVAHQLFLEASKIKEVREADVFHTHIAGEAPMDIAICEQLAIELSRSFGKPLVVHLRGTFLPGPETMSLANERGKTILENASVIITHNMNVFEKLVEWNFGKKTILVPNDVDIEKFHISKQDHEKKGNNIAFVGRLTAYRDPLTAIFAFRHLLNRIPDIKLHIIGDGPLKTTVQHLVKELGLDSSVVVYGQRLDIDFLLQKCDVFWAISPISNYPSNSVLEALGSGLPVVATDTGLTRELIVDGQNGLLVAPKNPKELALATEEILLNNALRKSLVTNGRITAEKYDIKVIVPKIAQLYRNLTNSSS